MLLDDGARVGIIGGGPAGSLTAYFLLGFAQLMDLDLKVDIYEPRDFTMAGPGGCNMCGGIVSESLVQALAIEGIELPGAVVQRGIDSYLLHTNEASTRIDTPLKEMRIAAIHRGGGPRDAEDLRWGGLDGYLLGLAEERGANVVRGRVSDVGWEDGRPVIATKNSSEAYDLMIGATGVNSGGWDLYEKLGFKEEKPKTTKVYITELKLGEETISERFGNSMHIFLLDLPRLDCAAMIPKGDFVTVCLLGDEIDRDLIDAFFNTPAVRRCFPEGWTPSPGVCHCSPKINVREASQPFLDRVVLVGDCGATRLYKDGIGAAYRTAKAAAATAVFRGISAVDFEKGYWPTYRSIAGDNRYGSFMFSVIHIIKRFPPVVRGVTRMASAEQRNGNGGKRMSMVLWDMFTGSAAYREIFGRTLDPRFFSSFGLATALSIPGRNRGGRGDGQRSPG
jgi:flavin-dependent dehydrogenase